MEFLVHELDEENDEDNRRTSKGARSEAHSMTPRGCHLVHQPSLCAEDATGRVTGLVRGVSRSKEMLEPSKVELEKNQKELLWH